MKTASLPSIRVEPEVRDELEGMLHEGETVSSFIEKAVREGVRRRQVQAEFLKRGMESLARFEETGTGSTTEEVLAKLEAKLEAARALKAKKRA
ncbi:YlcI/YnfO family protein [Burkholderiaceae bacterium UC74_6]